MRNTKTAELVLTALFAAIIIIMAFTPLGYIPLVVINATIIHIPVILGALFCGPKKGGFLGFVFGLTSFIKNTVMPSSLSAFVFSPVLAASMVGTSGIFINKVFDANPLSTGAVWAISAIVGVVVFAALEVFTLKKSGSVSAFIYAGVVGAMTNTIFVMGGIFVLYKNAYADALSIDPGAVLGVIGGVISFNGVIEAIVAAIIVAALGVALNKIKPIQK